MKSRDVEKLTSVDQYGDRLLLIPAEVTGFFRKYRDWSQLFLIALFLVLPWTQIGGQQTVLLNIADREFNLFGVLFHAHDAPLIFFIVAGAALTLALVTSIWGRVWCGWTCPQTVFIDGIFRRIERLIEGDYLKRKALLQEPLSFRRALQLMTKWFLFFAAASLIAHSFVAYFVGAQSLSQMIILGPQENWGLFILVTLFTFVFIFDFVWFREQFCVIMCPYGRIQGLLYDQNTQTVAYDIKRGEPRRSSAQASDSTKGDCVDCGRCVSVCPTGIDIRNGLQMECIACTACVDACDEIMEKVKKPKGLIRYMNLDGGKSQVFKPRNLFYMAAIALCALGLIISLLNRQSSHITLLRGSANLFSIAEDQVIHHFKLHITNQSYRSQEYQLQLINQQNLKQIELVAPQNPNRLAGGEIREWHFFVKIPLSEYRDQTQLTAQILITDPQDSQGLKKEFDLILLGPKTQ